MKTQKRQRRQRRQKVAARHIAAAAAALLVAAPAWAQDDLGIPLGTVAKAVTIEDLDGRPVDLGQFIGKKAVLLEFWATWCPLCRALEPKMVAAQRQHGDRVEFIVVAVAVNQSKASIKRHLERHPMPFRVLWDTNGNAVRAFQAPSTSYVVTLDASGKVAYTGAGEDQDIEAAVQVALPKP
ncbi:MAG TPA: TlpA disulfide reductase family protein [Gemmatimonadales bacterium]|nr:TlpA disulfide reductase family protein [Gemmatimonadales bacterium]